jgi:hypothetical protein
VVLSGKGGVDCWMWTSTAPAYPPCWAWSIIP